MHVRVRTALASVALLAYGGALSGQEGRPLEQPVFRTNVELVTIDVTVVDAQGQPVRGLTSSDFTVTVDGEPRRIVTAEFVDAAGARNDGAGLLQGATVSSNEGAGAGRMLVFMVDQNTLEAGHVRRVADAASRLIGQLSFSDRSALTVLPNGPNVEFTWAHNRVQEAFLRVMATSTPFESEFGSLTEARDIANGRAFGLRSLGLRECGGLAADALGTGADSGGALSGPPPSPGQGGPPGSAGSGQAGATGGSGGTVRSAGGGGSADLGDACTRNLQMRAESVWRSAQVTALSSLAGLRNALAALGRVPGDKTVVLVSGGWALDERDEESQIRQVADDAVAARATVFTMFVPETPFTIARRVPSSKVVDDQSLLSRPLEHLAGLTGGGTFRVYVGAEGAFGRMAREMSGFYRIGVERTAADNGPSRRMKVQVGPGGATVRARQVFDTRTYEDRDWTARLASALYSPVVATGIGLRVTSYVTADPADSAHLQLVLAGEASRVGPGEATFKLLVQDLQGRKVVSGDQPMGEPTEDGLTFSARVAVPPGRYIARVALMDGTGRTGSVEHPVDVRHEQFGDIRATGPLLVRVPGTGRRNPQLALSDTRQDERLAMQVHLNGDAARLASTSVAFDIATPDEGRSLVRAVADVSSDAPRGWLVAQGVANLRVLPPGRYVVRAKVAEGDQPVGELRRGFVVAGPNVATAGRDPGVPASSDASYSSRAPSLAPVALAGAPFRVGHVLQATVLDPFLDQVAARPDASSPVVRDLLGRARTSGVGQLAVPDALAAQQPVAAFLKGLTQLARNELDPAANTFRATMRAAPDLFPAMVYLGACYAAGGRDKEAAAAWRTALIKEGDTRQLHLLLADALLRQQQGEPALRTIEAARARWPADVELKRRLVVAALLAGRRADAFQVLDELVAAGAGDEPTLMAGLLVLYEAIERRSPVQDLDRDRALMVRVADAYRDLGGPSMALVDTWLAAARR